MDQQDADVWNQKRKDKSAGSMIMDQRKNQEIKRLQSQLENLEREMQQVILPDCQRQARKTKAWENNRRDSSRLRDEIAKLKAKPSHNPLSVASNEAFTREKVVGEQTGKTGEDTVY